MAFDPSTAEAESAGFDPSSAELVQDSGFIDTVVSGTKGTLRAIGATADLHQGDRAELLQAGEAATAAQSTQDERLAKLKQRIAEEKKRLGEDAGWWDTAKALGSAAWDNPAGAGLLLAEQLPNSAAAMGGGWAGLKAGALVGGTVGPVGATVGGIAGGVIGMFGANYALEGGNKAIEAAQEGKLTDADLSRIKEEGATKAGVITGVDVATLGLTGKLFGATQRAVDRAGARVLAEAGVDATDRAAVTAAVRANPALIEAVQAAERGAYEATTTLGQRAIRGGAAVSLETLSEGVGEYWGEGVATGKWDKMEAMIEAFSSLGQSTGEAAWVAARNKVDPVSSILSAQDVNAAIESAKAAVSADDLALGKAGDDLYQAATNVQDDAAQARDAAATAALSADLKLQGSQRQVEIDATMDQQRRAENIDPLINAAETTPGFTQPSFKTGTGGLANDVPIIGQEQKTGSANLIIPGRETEVDAFVVAQQKQSRGEALSSYEAALLRNPPVTTSSIVTPDTIEKRSGGQAAIEAEKMRLDAMRRSQPALDAEAAQQELNPAPVTTQANPVTPIPLRDVQSGAKPMTQQTIEAQENQPLGKVPTHVGGQNADLLSNEQLQAIIQNKETHHNTRRAAQAVLGARFSQYRMPSEQILTEEETSTQPAAQPEPQQTQSFETTNHPDAIDLKRMFVQSGFNAEVKLENTNVLMGKSRISTGTAKVLNGLAKMLGKKVVYFSASKQVPGAAVKNSANDNRVWINVDDPMSPLRLLGHETLHKLKQQSPKAYATLRSAMAGLMTDDVLIKEWRNYFGEEKNETDADGNVIRKGRGDMTDAEISAALRDNATREMIIEEMLGDLSGNRFAEPEFWTQVFEKIEQKEGREKAKGLIAKLKEAVLLAINKIQSMLRGEKFAADGFLDEIEHLDGVRKALSTAYAQYISDVRDGKVADENATVSEGGASYASPNAAFKDQTLPTRWPTAAKATPSVNDDMVTDIETLKQDEKQLKQAVDAVVGITGMHPPITKDMSVAQKLEYVIERLKDNVIWLHDMVPADARERTRLWYKGARKVAERWAQKYNISNSQAAGILAVLSPQKDWYMNVTMAERILDIMDTKMTHLFDKNMRAAAFNFMAAKEEDASDNRMTAKNKREIRDAFDIASTKTLKQVIATGNLDAVGVWLRSYDEAYHGASHNRVSPEGDFLGKQKTKAGEDAKRAWGSFDSIGKAASVFVDGRPENINDMIGGEHKVRNFYNNIFAPEDPRFVTIDTHAVAADTLHPVSGNDQYVKDAFGATGGTNKTGLSGSYAIHYEAYQRAAKERGVLPREMQSITWEAVRMLFEDTFKTATSRDFIDGIWSAVDAGTVVPSVAREWVHDYAEKIDHPDWWYDTSKKEGKTYAQQKEPFVGTRITFEVAPNPDNKEVSSRWNKLPFESRAEISRRVAWRVIAKAFQSFGKLETTNMKGEMHEQIGGYLDDNNTSFSIWLNKYVSGSNAGKLVQVIGHALRQKEMVRTSPKPFDTGRKDAEGKPIKSSEMGAIVIKLPQGWTPQQIGDFYLDLRKQTGISGHTTIDSEMVVLAEGDGVELGKKIDEYTGGKYDVTASKLHVDFANKGENDYDLQSGTGHNEGVKSQSPLLSRADQLRAFADGLTEQLIRDAELRPNDAGSAVAGGGTASLSRPRQQKGAVTAEGVHYSTTERKTLSSSAFGTGLKGAELERVQNATDPRIKHRIYFYVNGGNGINPEAGVGAHAHKATLSNLYDHVADSDDLKLGRDANEFESAVLDAGYDGYVDTDRGVAILLGQRAQPVEYVGLGQKPTVEKVKNAPQSDYGKAVQSVINNNSLPGGQMTGAAWKRLMPKLMPEVDVSHLEDGKDYYRNQIVKQPEVLDPVGIGVKFSLRRGPAPKKTVTAYKLFVERDGQLFPLYVNANEPIPVGKWLDADAGELVNGKVKSKLGPLAYRPGWHAGDLPIATHIGEKDSVTDKKPRYRSSNHVWAEVEMAADVDWQSVADSRAEISKSGKPIARTAHITDQVPVNGFYRYKTNSNMTGNWLIGGAMKVVRTLSDSEVKAINDAAGVADLPRRDGDVRFSRTRTPQFDNWFGSSTITDAEGKPAVMYHGTARDITTFRPKQADAIFLTFDPEFAEGFADMSQGWMVRNYSDWMTPEQIEAAKEKAIKAIKKDNPPGRYRDENIREVDNGYASNDYLGAAITDQLPSNANIMPLFVRAENPFDFRNPEHTKALEKAIGHKWDGYEYMNGEQYETTFRIGDLERGEWNAIESDAVQKYIRANHDSFWVRENGTTNLAVFEPNQVKSASGNNGQYSREDNDIRYSLPRQQPWYYSALEDGIKSMPAKVSGTPATNVALWLKSNAEKLKIKKDELEWSGVMDYLAMLGKQKITADDLADWVAKNGVKVTETVLDDGEPTWFVRDLGKVVARGFKTEDEAIDWAEQSGSPTARVVQNDERSGSSKFSSYVLPGGENYKELLITLPQQDKNGVKARLAEIADELSGNVSSERYSDLVKERARLAAQYRREFESGVFRSSHFDTPNILAHIRMNERTDADGNRVLFIEEIQSDWGQKGKKEGFGLTAKEKAEVEALMDKAVKVRGVVNFSAEDKARWDELGKKAESTDNIPSAPFVTDTKSWTSLALKRAIAYAVDNGFDSIAWTTGEQQVRRYPEALRQVADHIEWDSTSDGKGVSIYKAGARILGADVATDGTISRATVGDAQGKHLSEIIGKTMAQKVIDSTHGEIKGEDFTVGGEGMKGFYDAIVPQVAKKLGAQVGVVTFSASKGWRVEENEDYRWDVYDRNGERVGTFGDKDEAEQYMREEATSDGRMGANDQPGFTITDQMREQASGKGMPLFSTPRSALTGQPINQVWQNTAPPSAWDEFVRKMQDKLIDTKRILAEIRKAGVAIKETLDPYLQETLYHGRAAKRVSEFAESELKPLLVEMHARGIEMQEIEDYLWARHAAERNAQVAKVNQNMPDGGSGLTNKQAADILAGQKVTINGRDIQIRPAKMAAYQSIAARVKKITEGTLDTLVAYGLESQDTVDTWKKTYQNYIPLMRDMESDDNYMGAFGLGMGTGQGFSVRGSASKRALGSERGVIDILANLAMQRERAITRGEKNRVAQSVYGLAISAPNTEFWVPVNPDAKDPAKLRQLVQELIDMGLNPIDAQNIANEPKQRYIDPRTGLVAERINPQLRGRQDVLSVRVNGKDRFVMFSSDERAQHMVRNLKNLDNEELGLIMQNMAVVTRWFASVNTQYNPVFGLTNGIRDLGAGALNLSSTALKNDKAAVLKGAFAALRGIYSDLRDHRAGRTPTSQWAQLFEEFQREGGQTGYRDMFQTSKARTDALAKELKDAGKGNRWLAFGEKSHIFGWLSDYNTSIENAVRLSAYKVAKDKGMSNQQAAALAKNLTVNFNKKGLAATQAGAMYAFFNAAVQGTARIGETMVKDGKLSPAGQKILYGGMMLGVMQAVMFALAGYDDEEPPQHIREKNLVIPGPDGKYVSIPMPLGFHVIPNIGRIATEFALSGFKNPGKRMTQLAGLFMDSFNPLGGTGGSVTQMLSPTITDPIVALNENRDWTGKNIYKEDFNKMKPTAGWTRTKDTASDFSKAMSYGINYITGGGKYEIGILSPTPDQIDYLIGQATGGVGRETLKLWQAGKTPISGEELPMYKIPVAGRFIGETTGQSSESSKFYANLKRIGEHHSVLDEMKDAKDGDARLRYLAKHPDARMVQMADKASREVAYLKRKKRDALEKGDSERVKLLEMQITNKIKQWNARLSEKE